ncbi:MAG: hypothetical protein KHZ77_00315 [Veillonella sp.]|uniref:hypothetical protein n=1 Tax=Veillonella sp. TaxID=1926307 RepID=UPI0025CE2A80|nr:hypothetical protein [Veillonella sp.]MBS4912595.1 hypothetical protein [Veillonella sp.]
MKIFGIMSNSREVLTQIEEVANTVFNPKTTSYKAYCYENTSEIPHIIQSEMDVVDGWIFSGETPLEHAKPYMSKETPAVSCNLNGLEIYRYLLQCLALSKHHELRVSIDLPLIGVKIWNTVIEESGISFDKVHLVSYDSMHIDENDANVATEHKALWDAGKIERVLTSSTKIRKELERLNIPVIQMHGSNFTIHNALLKLKEKRMQRRLVENEVALMRIETIDIEKLMVTSTGSLQFQMLMLRLKEKILELCQELQGSYMVEKENGRFEVFATRGIIERNAHKIRNAIEDIRLSLTIDVMAGIGFGYVAFDAQRNAWRALSYGKQQEPRQAMVAIDMNNNIKENMGTEHPLTFTSSLENPDILKRLESVGVGTRNYMRIWAIAQKLGHGFTSNELAQQMGVTDRNARRIIKNLLAAELVICVGEEALTTRGRPTKKYSMNPKFQP